MIGCLARQRRRDEKKVYEGNFNSKHFDSWSDALMSFGKWAVLFYTNRGGNAVVGLQNDDAETIDTLTPSRMSSQLLLRTIERKECVRCSKVLFRVLWGAYVTNTFALKTRH